MTARPPLITDHWFRERPVRADGSDGYWICDRCGQHRGDHLQAEGHWRLPFHGFTPQRIRPTQCKRCGRRQRHTTHTPWLWEQLEANGD